MPGIARGDALVLSPPGVGSITVREARQHGVDATMISRDRRADIVGVRCPPALLALRTAEDVLAAVATLTVRTTASATASALDGPSLRDALDLLHRVDGTKRRGLRVVVRLSDERHFRRTELRSAIERQLGRMHDPHESAHELWVVQTDRRTLHVGVRLRARSRRGARRTAERPGALRPAIAAAMVLCAGLPRVALDPCCGTGTLLAEVAGTGGAAVGGDIDPAAVVAAERNVAVPLVRLDARRLPFATDSFEAVVTNLPFGREYGVQGSPTAWYRRTLSESLRVAPTVVVLAAPTTPFRQALGRTNVDLLDRHDVVVLGQRAAIWTMRRRQ